MGGWQTLRLREREMTFYACMNFVLLDCIGVVGQWQFSDADHERVVLERCQICTAVDGREGKCHNSKPSAVLNLECGARFA